MKHAPLYFITFFVLYVLKGLAQNTPLYQSETLEIQKITDHVYQHISFLDTESFGKVPCNGMIVFDEGEAIIFDTPTDDATARELIDWVENNLKGKVTAVIPTHFHIDCLGGLDAFHQRGISSYASNKTIALAKANQAFVPHNGFDSLLELKVGDEPVVAAFTGEGHTRDNIVGYVPGEKVLFGGCLVKEVGAGKGNLEDANVQEWPLTMDTLKNKYPDVKIVIPGHGKPGGTELLDYTATLFSPE